jgi:hypothetical protein
MSDTSAAGYVRSEPDESSERWWTKDYAARLSIALVIAGAVVGVIFGPVALLLGQLRVALSGGTLTYPAWMYLQNAGVLAVLGILIASSASIAAVLLPAQPTSRGRLLLRGMTGPLVAGGLLAALALPWGVVGISSGFPIALIGTAFGCSGFILAMLVSRTSRVEERRAASSV